MVDNMKKNIFKKITAFSLVEVLLSMAILSIFIVGTMKVMTVKPAARKIEYPHGYFECFWDANNGGQLRQRHFFGNSLKYDKSGGTFCTFEPPTGAAFLNIHLVSTLCNTLAYDENLKVYVDLIDSAQSLIHSETQSYANNVIEIYPQKGNSPTKLVSYEDIEKTIKHEYSYESAVLNTSEYTLLQHMKLVTQSHTLPLMYDRLYYDKIGCKETGDGYYGGVFISW